jgi:hypothetical protein
VKPLSRSPLTDEAFQALFRMKQDIYAVGAAASECGTSFDRAVLKLILRNAAHAVVRAFSADDGQREEAWKHLILVVDELLRHRRQFRATYDRVELTRLQAFVRENPDAFERVSYLRLVRTI